MGNVHRFTDEELMEGITGLIDKGMRKSEPERYILELLMEVQQLRPLNAVLMNVDKVLALMEKGYYENGDPMPGSAMGSMASHIRAETIKPVLLQAVTNA